jgi:hypothetical protein
MSKVIAGFSMSLDGFVADPDDGVDQVLGAPDVDRWVGTSVKINQSALEGARGLRIGIVPAREGASDRVRMDDRKNLVICPLPYDGSFMEVSTWAGKSFSSL